jgi:hypothetical protein
MLNELFDKFRAKTVPADTSPLDSLSAAHKWVDSLQQMHEYEAHRQVVMLLSAFNRAKAPFDIQRLHILGAIEHYGSKLQHGLITQFLKNHADYKYAGKSLWQEIVAFYWQLAQAYHDLTSAVLQHKESATSALPTLVLRALHYQGKLIQWRYLRYELPTQHTWHTLHKLYRVAEQHGFARQSMVLKGSAYCSCEHVYARILLLHLMRPVGLKPGEIELAAYWAWKWREAVSLSRKFDAAQHTHCIALSASLPPQSLNGHEVALDSIRYWGIHGVIALMEGMGSNSGGNTKLIKLYGVPFADSPDALLRHIHTSLTSTTSLADTSLFDMPAAVNVSCGEHTILEELRNPGSNPNITAYYQATGHPGEAYYRLNITPDVPCKIKAHDLLVSYDESRTRIQTLAAIRWMEESASATITLGMERFGIDPQLIELHQVQDSAAPSPFQASTVDRAFTAIAEAKASTLVSFQHMKHRYYDMREGDYIYRIRIQTLLEQKPGWLRAQFVRLSRRYQPI